MIRTALFFGALLVNYSAAASSVEDVLKLWASQAGLWTGEIDIYGPGGGPPQTVGLRTVWQSTPDQLVPVKIETFQSPTGSHSSVTLMLANPDNLEIITPYFANGQQRDYRFSVISVTQTDTTHWTTIIASPGGEEIYEDRPAVLRYVRTRDGDTVENTKEVNFLDDNGDDTFELRSYIRQQLQPATGAP